MATGDKEVIETLTQTTINQLSQIGAIKVRRIPVIIEELHRDIFRSIITRGVSFRRIMSKPNVVFVLGRPGSGKGTQCSKIVEEFGFVHLSAGDLLREERSKPSSEFGELIETHIRNGTIVPVEITCALIDKAMASHASRNFLIDGFPRSQGNLEGWEREMSDKTKVLFVLLFDCPEEECVRRCLDRGQAGSGRSDDNEESLKKRIFTYNNDTQPIINHFLGKNMVQRIDASHDADTVFTEVRSVFKSIEN